MKISPAWALCPLGAMALFPAAVRGELIQGPFGPGGTWNVYETGLPAATYADALTNAQSRKFDPVTGTVSDSGSVAGTLPNIFSAEANAFLNRTSKYSDNWIGLTDREGWAPDASEGNFRWTSGAPVTYTNWADGEPNDYKATPEGGEDAGQMGGNGQWNDNAADLADRGDAPNFGYSIEYATGSATPLPGIKLGSVLPAPGSLPGPNGSVGTWGVREVRGLVGPTNVGPAVERIMGGGGTVHTGQLAKLDVTDPNTNGTGGPVLSSAPLTFLSNDPGADDNDITTSAKGKIQVTEAGTYTIQVRSDDGFALRIVGKEFSSVNGSGSIDPVDRSTIFFDGGTGDANTRGVIDLDAGVYDVEFVHWEGGGGAYYEVTSTQGAVTDPNTAQWLALGDGSRQEARNSNPVRLNGAATVKNAANPGGGNNLGAAKTIFAGGGTTYSKTVTTLSIPEEQMPIAEQTDPSVRDNYVTEIIGKLLVDDGKGPTDEKLGITFHLASDDGSSLQILGEDFLKIADFTGDGEAVLADEGGDTVMVADYPTGNTNAFGYIELVEGEYDFKILHTEGGGGSNFNLYYALGDWTERGWDPAAFRLLTTDNILLAANQGLALVPEPTTGLLGLSALGLFAARRRRK